MSAPKTRLKERVKAAEVAACAGAARGPARFYNRELSWLQFNRRVLEEAHNDAPSPARAPALPVDLGLQPRRVLHGAGGRPLRPGRRRRHAGEPGRADAGPAAGRDQPLRRRPRQRPAGALGTALRAEMAAAGIHIVEPKELRPPEREWLDRQFISQYLPILTPLAVDPSHPFPFIQNGGITVGVELQARARRHHHARAAADPEPARPLHPPAAGRGRAQRRRDADPLHPHRVR